MSKLLPLDLFMRQALLYPLDSPFLPPENKVEKDHSYAAGRKTGSLVCPLVLDPMEYPNDAAARLAYVCSGQVLIDRTAGDIIGNCEGRCSNAWDGLLNQAYLSSAYHTVSNIFYIGKDWGDGNDRIVTGFRAYSSNDKGFILDYDYNVTITLQGSTDNFSGSIVDLGSSGPTKDANGLMMSKMDYLITTTAYRYHRLKVTHDGAVHNIYIAEVQFFETLLQCYSESTIVQQGTHSLKVIAKATGSLNETLTRTGPPENLSGKNTIGFYISASRTGSNIKIGIHDTGDVTTEITPNVISPNTWQEVEWNISGVADANKNTIDKITQKIVNADADNTYYIDNVRAY